MSGHQIAEGLASLGRGKDTMLMHVTPNEVAGLQNLAMAQGGSLTINPQTGLPEAGFFDDIIGVAAPIAVGAFLGGPLGLSALQAGLITGAAGFALSGGDLGAGLSAGLGGAGGVGLGKSLSAFATPEIAKTAGVDAVTRAGITNASTIPGSIGSDMLTSGVGGTFAGTVPYSGVAGGVGQMGAAISPANLVGATSGATEVLSSQIPTQTAMQKVGSGAMNAIKDPVGFFKGPGTFMDAATLASPFMAIQPETPKIPEDTSYQMKYEGPYTAQDRNPRLPTQAEMTQLAAQGSPEYSYFGNSNPFPGFNKAPGYAQGGVANLFGTPDGTAAQNTLAEPYGLGRLNSLASAASSESAKEYGFDAGGTIPYMPGAPSYGIAPTDLSAVAAIPTTPGQQAPNVNQQLNNATTDPMGRTTQGGMGGKGFSPYDPNRTQGGMGGKGGSRSNELYNKLGIALGGNKPPALTMQDYITAATRTYNPSASMAAAMDPTGAERAHFTNINPQPATLKAVGGGLKNGGFVVPADVVSHLGNGSTDAGLAALQKRHGAQPIRGAGDGMSDSIKTTINGRQPARVADGEAYIPPEQVKRSGGAKKFYAMMDKVRKERTGTKKQGKQINPNKFMTA